MGVASAILVYGLTGVALLAALVWYGQTVWRRLAPADDKTAPLGEMRVIGPDAAQAKALAEALPAMVVAQLEDMKRRWNTTSELLRELGLGPVAGDLGADRTPTLERLRQQADINFKVADVELGGLLTWLAREDRPTDAIEVTVHMPSDGKSAQIFGHRSGTRGHAWSVSSPGDLTTIVQTIAAAIWQHEVAKREAAIDIIPGPAFAAMVDARADFAVLMRRHQQAPLAEKDRRAAAAKLLDRLSTDVEQHRGWADLQELVAQIAEAADDWGVARLAFANLLSVTAPTAPSYAQFQARLARADENQRAAEARRQVAEQQPAESTKAVRELQTRTRGAAAGLPDNPRVAALLAAVGLDGPQSATSVRIGIVGGLPWTEALSGVSYELLPGGSPDDKAEDTLRDYQTTVVQVVRAVAPDVRFVFAPVRAAGLGMTFEELQASAQRLAEHGVEVLLFTWGAATPNPALNQALRAHAAKATVVLAAGNSKGTAVYADLTDTALVVAAADRTGAPAAFTSEAKGSVWAPGVDIPIVSPKTGKIETRSGTSYAAALVAGAAATLRHAVSSAGPTLVREALVATARPSSGRSEPPIIDVSAALRSLKGNAPDRGR